MFYIVPNPYEPGTAASNRFLALLKGLSGVINNGETARVIFFEPNKNHDVIKESIHGVSFNYCWYNQKKGLNPILKRALTLFHQFQFLNSLKKGDVVLMLGYPQMLGMLIRKRGIRLFHEMNEHPGIMPLGPRGQHVSLGKYLRWCRKLDGLFVISHHLRSYFVGEGINENKVHLYRMIVDPDRFVRIQRSCKTTPYIAYCGTATNYKDGVDVLLQAFSIVKQKYASEIKLHIYGKVPSVEEKEVNDKLIDGLGIKEDVIYKGVVSAEIMPQLLTNAAVLALARPDNIQAKYGFPTKLGEYLLTGNPVVVTSVGDIPLYLHDGENALLSKPDNPRDFANKILWALENQKEARIIGEKGRQTALEFFNPIVEARNIVNVISKS